MDDNGILIGIIFLESGIIFAYWVNNRISFFMRDNMPNRISLCSHVGMMSVVIVIIIAGFLLFSSLGLFMLYPSNSDDINIALLSGTITGGFILLVQKLILERNGE
jgi:hypothetical protein